MAPTLDHDSQKSLVHQPGFDSIVAETGERPSRSKDMHAKIDGHAFWRMWEMSIVVLSCRKKNEGVGWICGLAI